MRLQDTTTPTLDEIKQTVEAAVSKAQGDGESIVELPVPYAMVGSLCEWVESEGLRCAAVVESGKKASLAISLVSAPPPPRTSEELAAIAAKDAAIIAASEFARAAGTFEVEARFAALEARLAELEGGA